MTTVCLAIISLSGLWCADNAAPIGQCHPTWYGQECHVDSLPYFLSTYDYAICDEHPTNCSDPNNPAQGAVRMFTPADYGRVAACHPDMLWETLAFPGIPLTVRCEDTGGRIHPAYRQVWDFSGEQPELVWMWVNEIDVLWDHALGWPWWSLRAWEGEIQ